MYVLVVAHRVRRSQLLLQTRIATRLGSVSLAGFIRHSRGVSLTALRTYGSYALVYLLEGSGRMKSGNLPVRKCRAGDLLFIYPDIPHGYGPGPKEIWSELFIVFKGPVFDLWREAGLLQEQNPIRRLAAVSRWLPQLKKIVAPVPSESPETMLRRVCRLQKFLSDIAPTLETTPSTVPWLDQARRQLIQIPVISPQSIARSVGLSYETFRKEFTRHTGKPPARYRLHRLIEQAQILLSQRNLSNKQVADTLGFYDEFHFSRHFKAVTGQTPRHFRKSWPATHSEISGETGETVA